MHAAPARGRPFVLETPRTRVEGDELRGVGRVLVDGAIVLESLRLETSGPASKSPDPPPTAANVLLAPASARRELPGLALETLVAAERVPGLVAQWALRPATARGVALSFGLPGRGEAASHRAEGPRLVIERSRGTALLELEPAPDRWEAEGDGGRIRAVWEEPAPDGTLTLRLAGAEAMPLRALRPLAALERRADGALDAGRHGRLELETGIEELDQALAWAVARLAGAPEPGEADATALLVLEGRLCSGVGAPPAPGVPLPDPLALVAAARRAAWEGVSPWPLEAVREALDALPPSRLHAAGRSAAADLLDALGLRAEAAEARRTPTAASAGARRLPMAGGPPTAPDRSDRIVRLILGDRGGQRPGVARGDPPATDPLSGRAGGAGPAPGDEPDPLAAGFGAVLALGRAEPGSRSAPIEAAWGDVRAWMETGFGDLGVGRWAAGREESAAAALVPLALVHGLLGARPDAPFGQLRLAPRFPRAWTRFTVRRLPLGEARVDLAYARREGHRTFVLAPRAGRVPPEIVFEPVVPGRVERVEVDGRAAEADLDLRDGRTRVALKLPLDRERSITLVTTA